MQQSKYQILVDRWIRFYENKFSENRAERARALLVAVEGEAKRYGIWTDAKTAEIRALKTLAGRDGAERL